MANYFVLNNKFTPYSFDELIKPYQMYAKEYDKEEAALEAAGEKEFTAADLSSNPNSAAYKMYSEATSALQAASNELATKGLTGDLRNRIKTVARDYKRTMGNLTDAQDRLDKELALRAKEGDNHVYQQSTLSIDDFLGGKTPNQRGQKLDKITEDVAVEFQKRAAGITRDTWDKVFASNGDQIKGYYDVTTEKGLTDAQLDIILDGVVAGDGSMWKKAMENKTISDEQKAQLKGFRDIIINKKKAIGYDDYDSDYSKGLIDSAIVKGAHGGLGVTSHAYKEDREFETPELRFRKERARKEDEYRDITNGTKPFFTDAQGNKWYVNPGEKTIRKVAKDGSVTVAQKGTERAKALDELRKDFPAYFEDSEWLRFLYKDDKEGLRKGQRGDFNERQAKVISPADMGTIRRRLLNEELAKRGLSESDVVIYKDRDRLGYNDYKIVLKDGNSLFTVDGEEVQEPSRPEQGSPSTQRRETNTASTYGGLR